MITLKYDREPRLTILEADLFDQMVKKMRPKEETRCVVTIDQIQHEFILSYYPQQGGWSGEVFFLGERKITPVYPFVGTVVSDLVDHIADWSL